MGKLFGIASSSIVKYANCYNALLTHKFDPNQSGRVSHNRPSYLPNGRLILTKLAATFSIILTETLVRKDRESLYQHMASLAVRLSHGVFSTAGAETATNTIIHLFCDIGITIAAVGIPGFHVELRQLIQNAKRKEVARFLMDCMEEV
jgi:hypothetical protein